MAVMKAKQFVETALKIEQSPTVYYSVSGGAWCKWNGSAWNMDCVCMIKGILWGFDFNKQAPHGGAVYLSNGVKDDNANGIMKRCYNISSDFSHIEYGELMHMDGHVGIYIGNGQVVEATAAWEHKVQISQVSNDGRRSRNGVTRGYWKEHGKLEYIDYSDQKEQPVNKKTIEQLANEVIKGEWGNGEERKRRLTDAGYNYADVQKRVNEIVYGTSKKYIQINARLGVWCRIGGYGFNHPKYKVIPNGTKCELLAKNVGYANGYNWDKVIYDGREVYLPNAWNKYL